MPPSHEAGSSDPTRQLAFEHVAHLAVGTTANVELCRVVQGEHVGKLAAVKRLLPQMAGDPDFVSMFRDEMWMASALRHPNVAEVLGWGEDEHGLYLAVEFVRGVSLLRLMKSVMTTGEAFNERLIVYLAARVCAGLAAAHELRAPSGEFLNLVHRDLTPGNILTAFDGDVKISDFGLAKAKQRVTQTAIGVTKGELAYMSPEQVMGQRLDARSDLFALGVVMFEVFTHQRPWQVDTVKDALVGIVQSPHPDMAELCPKVDKALVTMVHRLLSKDPSDRFQSASELQQALENWLHLHGYRDSRDSLARFVRRNSMRQMRWLERALAGQLTTSDEMASPFDNLRGEGTGTPISSASGVLPANEEATRSIATRSRPTLSEDHAVTTQRRAPTYGSGTQVTRKRDASPPLGATEPESIALNDVPPPTVSYRDLAGEEATLPSSGPLRLPVEPMDPTRVDSLPRTPAGVRPPEPLPVSFPTRLERPAPSTTTPSYPTEPSRVSVPQMEEPSSPVPLVVHADDSQLGSLSIVEQLRLAAHQIRTTANQLAAKAGASAEQAKTSAKQAVQAAERAEDMARRAGLAADAVMLTSAAVRAAAAGDDRAAVEQLRRARELHKQATED
jgi:serine/threonine protein kinase